MAMPNSGSVTGSAVTGLTSPTYTLTPDNPTSNNGKQGIVTALGGTQAGVTTHTASDPFTVAIFKPVVYRLINFVTSAVVRKPPTNTWKVVVRKGLTYLAGQPKSTGIMTIMIELPAGVEASDSVEVKALISCACGYVSSNADLLATSVLTNSI